MPPLGWKRLRPCAMIDIHKYRDIHSHQANLALRGDTIVSISPSEEMLVGGIYSVGIHPWDTITAPTAEMIELLRHKASDSRVVAIGECGFDMLRGGSIEVQQAVFDIHTTLAEQLDKPLIIHAVRADHLILAWFKRLRPSVPWIIHGFRGSQRRAEALLRAGLYLSININHPLNYPTPPERTFFETD